MVRGWGSKGMQLILCFKWEHWQLILEAVKKLNIYFVRNSVWYNDD